MMSFLSHLEEMDCFLWFHCTRPAVEIGVGGGRSSTVVLGVSNVRKSRQLKSDQHPKGCDIYI